MTHSLYLSGVLVAVTLFLAAGAVRAQSQPAASQPGPLRVLFIGNSFVYTNDLPHQLQVLAADDSGGRPIEVKSTVHGGWTWQQHLDDGGAVNEIATGKWDFVVLQENSGSPLKSKEEMFKAGRTLAEAIAKSGAKTVLMLTWCRKAQTEQQPKITAAYHELGQELRALVAPVGEAWAKVRQARPTIELYNADGHHPSPAGTYLAACVLYQTLTGRTPVGLPVKGAPLKAAAQTAAPPKAATQPVAAAKLDLAPDDAALL